MGPACHGIKGWPADDRPREKLWRIGEQALSDAELLAILLGTGTAGQSAVDVARRILGTFGSLRGMSGAPMSRWRAIKGLGSAKAARITSALEIGRRMQEEHLADARAVVASAADAAQLVMPRLRDLPREVVKAILLNSRNKVIAIRDVEEGTVNAARPILREVFREAVERSASALICVHNHPGGDPHPSSEDVLFTQELCQAGAVLGIAVLDHIIIGNGTYYSFSDQGRLGPEEPVT